MNPMEKFTKQQEKILNYNLKHIRSNSDIKNVKKTHVIPVEVSHNSLKMENQILGLKQKSEEFAD